MGLLIQPEDQVVFFEATQPATSTRPRISSGGLRLRRASFPALAALHSRRSAPRRGPAAAGRGWTGWITWSTSLGMFGQSGIE